MRTRLFSLLFIFYGFLSYSQEVTPPTKKDSLRNTTKKYLVDTRKSITYPVGTTRATEVVRYNGLVGQPKLDLYYKDFYRVFNPNMLNVFFENEINSFASNITDLSTDKYIVTANTTEKILTIGRTLDWRNVFYKKNIRPVMPMELLTTLYIKNKYDKGFSDIYSQDVKSKEYIFSSDFGVGLKITLIRKGTIYYNDNTLHDQKEKIRKIREEVVFPPIDDEINRYIKSTLATSVVSTINTTSTTTVKGVNEDTISTISTNTGTSTSTTNAQSNSLVNSDKPIVDNVITKTTNTTNTTVTPAISLANEDEKIYRITYSGTDLTEKEEEKVTEKYYEFYKKIADKEIEILKKEKLYSWYLTGWVTLEGYYGLQQKDVTFKNDLTAGTIKETERFREFNIDLSIDGLASLSNGTSVNGKVHFNVANTNNFIINKTVANVFETIAPLPNNQQTVTTTESIFIGSYDEFVTTSSRVELSFLTFKNSVGLSGALEHFYGTYKARNWKVGVPVSFKDKDKKPTLNFELQWKEINKLHYLGVTVGFPFGKFLK